MMMIVHILCIIIMFILYNVYMTLYVCVLLYFTIGSSVAVKREGDEGSSTVPVIEPPKHMGENVHVFECLQDFDTKAASKVSYPYHM